MKRELALGVALLTACSPSAAVEQLASAYDPGFAFQYLDREGPNACSPDWFAVEHGRWMCLRKTPADRLIVVRLGGPLLEDGAPWLQLPALGTGDRRLLLAKIAMDSGGGEVISFDSLTLQRESLGHLPPEVRSEAAIAVDRDGDGRSELAMRPAIGSTPVRLISMPGGPTPPFQILDEIGFRPFFAAQIDQDPQQEMAQIDGSSLRFVDALTLGPQSFRPAGVYSDAFPALVWDWDADGIDEMVVPHCCPGPLALLDPDRPDWTGSVVVGGAPPRPLTVMAWSAPQARDLILWSESRISAIDPVTGNALGNFGVYRSLYFPAPLLLIDWDADGDEDLLWQEANRLWLLRNPEGPEERQFGSLSKQLLGYSRQTDPPRLVSIEQFSGPEPTPLRLRIRDAETLRVVHESDLGRSDTRQEFGLGDFHPEPGIEVVQISSESIRLRGNLGTVHWEKRVSSPLQQQFVRLIVPDFTCAGVGCRYVLMKEERIQSPRTHRIVLLDGETGAEMWSLDDPSGRTRTIGLTDLDGDGIPELLYSERLELGGNRLIARNGSTYELQWQVDVPESPVAFKRADGRKGRLAVLGAFGTLSLLNPITGTPLRHNQLSQGGCFNCTLDYLPQSKSSGQWVIQGLGNLGLLGVRHDLRGLDWRIPDLHANVRAMAPDRLHVGENREVRVLRLPIDELFTDDFESW